jgi:hypothetical protein
MSTAEQRAKWRHNQAERRVWVGLGQLLLEHLVDKARFTRLAVSEKLIPSTVVSDKAALSEAAGIIVGEWMDRVEAQAVLDDSPPSITRLFR